MIFNLAVLKSVIVKMNYFPNGGSGAMTPNLPPSAAIVNTNQGVGLSTHPVSPQVVQVAEHRM